MSENSESAGDKVSRFEVPFGAGILAAAVGWAVIFVAGLLLYTGFNLPKIAIVLLTAFAASSTGGLVGFLFGVPKGPADSTNDQEQSNDISYRPNTNLEQVSDWLTKIIVGVALIQFREIGIVIYGIGRGVGAAIGDIQGTPGSGTVYAIALLVSSGVMAFLLSYMWTTTTLYDAYSTNIARHNRKRRRRAIA
jgi:hypothetical protein